MRGPVSLAALLIIAAVAPGFAHHSFGVYFDADKTVKLSGVVTKIDWRNPHTHLYIDVKDESGKVVNWTLEGYPPNVLARTGWKKDVTGRWVTRSDSGWRARDGSRRRICASDAGQRERLFFGPPDGTARRPCGEEGWGGASLYYGQQDRSVLPP